MKLTFWTLLSIGVYILQNNVVFLWRLKKMFEQAEKSNIKINKLQFDSWFYVKIVWPLCGYLQLFLDLRPKNCVFID